MSGQDDVQKARRMCCPCAHEEPETSAITVADMGRGGGGGMASNRPLWSKDEASVDTAGLGNHVVSKGWGMVIECGAGVALSTGGCLNDSKFPSGILKVGGFPNHSELPSVPEADGFPNRSGVASGCD